MISDPKILQIAPSPAPTGPFFWVEQRGFGYLKAAKLSRRRPYLCMTTGIVQRHPLPFCKQGLSSGSINPPQKKTKTWQPSKPAAVTRQREPRSLRRRLGNPEPTGFFGIGWLDICPICFLWVLLSTFKQKVLLDALWFSPPSFGGHKSGQVMFLHTSLPLPRLGAGGAGAVWGDQPLFGGFPLRTERSERKTRFRSTSQHQATGRNRDFFG